MKFRFIRLGSAGVGSCPRLSNQCTFGLANQQARRHPPNTELEFIRFWTLMFGELVWNLSTQVNNGILAAYIAVFDLRRGKLFITFLVYALVYPIIASNLATISTLIPWSDSFRAHTCSPFLRKPLLR